MHESRCEGELKWIQPVDRERGLKRVGMGTGGIRDGEDGKSTRRDTWSLGVSWDELETLSNGNSQVSLRVALVKTPRCL